MVSILASTWILTCPALYALLLMFTRMATGAAKGYPIYMHWLISGQLLKTRIFMDPTILKCAIVHPHHLT